MNTQTSKAPHPILQILLSCILCGLGFYVLTGSAFIQSRETAVFLSEHLLQRTLLQSVAVLFTGLLCFVIHRANPALFWTLEPVAALRHIIAIAPAKAQLVFLAITYALTQFWTLAGMHAGLGTAMWDLGFYDQILWDTAHGNLLRVTVRGGLNLLGHHFEPIFLILAPLYWFSSNIHILFAFMSLAGAANLILVYFIAKEITKSKKTGLLFSLIVFFYQPLQNAVTFPLQTQTFADPLLLLGFFGILTRRNILGLTSLFLALLCKENIVIDVGAIGLFLLFGQKRKIGWLVGIMAAVMLLLITKVVEPHFFWHQDTWNKWNYISVSKFLDPATLQRLWEPNPLVFLFVIFAPVLFLPFRVKGWLLLGPSLALRLISDYGGLRLITAHYNGGLNALIFIASVYGYAAWEKKTPVFPSRAALLILSSILFAGTPQLVQLENHAWEASFGRNQKTVRILQHVPEKYSVVSTEVFLAHLTHRPHIFSFTSVLPGTPLEPIRNNADLLIVDEDRIQGGERVILQQFVERGYRSIFLMENLQVYASPGIPELDVEALQKDWEVAAAAPEVPYRKKIRHLYKTGVTLSAAALLLFLSLRRRRQIL